MLATGSQTCSCSVDIEKLQVGNSGRLILAPRFDKQGEPFEAYPGISIANSSEP